MNFNIIINDDCMNVFQAIPNKSVQCCITSPPYANQRLKQYGGISEQEYPQWTLGWLQGIKHTLKQNASVLIVIRAHIKNGILSDYILKTRLLAREAGWIEPDELVWIKPDAPPLGSTKRLRRCFEHILWFSNSSNPKINLKETGNKNADLHFRGSKRFGEGGDSPIHGGQQRRSIIQGNSRGSDCIIARVGEIKKHVRHPAMFPESLSDQLVRIFSSTGDVVMDPFCGAGTTCISSKRLRRKFLGIEKMGKYAQIAIKNLKDTPQVMFPE